MIASSQTVKTAGTSGSTSTLTKFSHVRPGDTAWNTGGLRDFFMYRDLGVAAATHGRVSAQLVRANLAPDGTGTTPNFTS
jgi:hypothetical protein